VGHGSPPCRTVYCGVSTHRKRGRLPTGLYILLLRQSRDKSRLLHVGSDDEVLLQYPDMHDTSNVPLELQFLTKATIYSVFIL
jgi:hypothetical protein